MFSINSIQLGPQGLFRKHTYYSPYSGSVFALGIHIIDLKKLTKPEYQHILPIKNFLQILKSNPNKEELPSRVPYESILGKETDPKDLGKQKEALLIAFKNFQLLDKNCKIKEEFLKFKEENNYWLKKDSLYEALLNKHGDDNWQNWNDDLDKDLFSKKYSKEQVTNRILEIQKNFNHIIKFHEFSQFIAHKQFFENKKDLNSRGISVLGDCLIGFSPRELWAYKNAFQNNYMFGVYNEKLKKFNYWELPAPDFDKIGNEEKLGSTGKLFKKKFDILLKRYDGIRIDAAWELVNPWVYSRNKNGDISIKGYINDVDDKLLKLLHSSARRIYGSAYNPEKLSLELFGNNEINRCLDLTRNKWPHIETISDIEDGMGKVSFYKKKVGYSDDGLIVGIGSHDNISLIDLAKNKKQEQSKVLAKELNLDENELISSEEKFRNAKFAEIFTTKNQFFTAFDALGISERFNYMDEINKDNWTLRIPNNYEIFYHNQLIKGFGLNLPEVLAIPIKLKAPERKDLILKLKKASDILREPGPLTEKEANKTFGEDFSSFSYNLDI